MPFLKSNRKRVATVLNFLPGFSYKFGKKKYITGFKMPDHESYTSKFFQYFTT